jgi:hypothetical protein
MNGIARPVCASGVSAGPAGPFEVVPFRRMPKVADKNKAHYKHLMVWSGNGVRQGETSLGVCFERR